jgi:hypothetical protein
MTKLLSLFAILTMAATLAFGQAADKPASTTDSQDANAPRAARTDDTQRKDHNWGWIGLLGLAGLVVSLGANATSATEIGMQRRAALLPECRGRAALSGGSDLHSSPTHPTQGLRCKSLP